MGSYSTCSLCGGQNHVSQYDGGKTVVIGCFVCDREILVREFPSDVCYVLIEDVSRQFFRGYCCTKSGGRSVGEI